MDGILAQIVEFFNFIASVIKEFFGFFGGIIPTTKEPATDENNAAE